MVKKYSAADLTKQIAGKQVITKQSVLNEMKAKAADPDIEVQHVSFFFYLQMGKVLLQHLPLVYP